MDIENLIKVQALSATQAERIRQFGPYTKLVDTVKQIYTPENELGTKGATNGRLPIIRLDNWDAAYMALAFEAHPGLRNAFNEMYNEATAAFRSIQSGNAPSQEELQAFRAIRELSGPKSEQIQRFLKMIEDANDILENESAKGKQGTRKHSSTNESIQTLRNNGVTFDASSKHTLDDIVHNLRAHSTKSQLDQRMAS